MWSLRCWRWPLSAQLDPKAPCNGREQSVSNYIDSCACNYRSFHGSLLDALTHRSTHTIYTRTAAAADSTAAAAAAVVVDSQPEAAAHIELKLAASDSDDDHIDDQHPDDVALIGDAAAATATTAKPSPDNEQGFTSAEQTADFWRQGAQRTLREHLQQRPNTRRARNVIFFMGDGMSLPTVTAARMYMGQQRGESGEEAKLEFEQFPHVGLSKVCSIDFR